jgi:hypothetical protein
VTDHENSSLVCAGCDGYCVAIDAVARDRIRHHDGQVYGVIREGTLTRTVSNCQVDGVFSAGSPVTEGSGHDHVHIGRNLEQLPLVMWISYIEPAGTPMAVDVPDPGCGF